MNAAFLGKRIKYFREKSGLTQAKLSELIGKTNHHITGIERGVALPSLPMLYDISQVLRVPIDCFLIDDGDSMYAQYCALKYEQILDRYSQAAMISYNEIQGAIWGAISKYNESPQLWENNKEKDTPKK